MKSQDLIRSDATKIWTAALHAVDPEVAVRKFLKRSGRMLTVGNGRFDIGNFRNIWAVGGGKAAVPMGRAVEKILGKFLTGGLLVTKYGHGLTLSTLEVIESGHPLPDKNSVAAAKRIISLVKNKIETDDFIICLLSGGASSLIVSPARGITLDDKLACTHLLLNAGVSIHELNAVRKHLSNLKGGGLARLLAPSRFVSLTLSDVVGDDLGTIASGPLEPDPSTFTDCIEIFRERALLDRIPAAVKQRLQLGAAGRIEETLKMGDPAFHESRTVIIGSNARACTAAAQTAKRLGYNSMVLTSRLEGDNEGAARLHMNVASEIVFEGRPLRRPACIISGGETTVKVTGNGVGGRNQEFALHCAKWLADMPSPCLVASLGTDGTDGPTDAAGAIADNTTKDRSLKHGEHFFNDSLSNNDSYRFFKLLGDLIVTGPTRTNVMDLHIILLG